MNEVIRRLCGMCEKRYMYFHLKKMLKNVLENIYSYISRKTTCLVLICKPLVKT